MLLNLFRDPQFRKFSRKYNSAFAFTSLGVKLDQELANARNGVYTFRIHGQVSHLIGSLTPADGRAEEYAQIYILDPQQQVFTALFLHNV